MLLLSFLPFNPSHYMLWKRDHLLQHVCPTLRSESISSIKVNTAPWWVVSRAAEKINPLFLWISVFPLLKKNSFLYVSFETTFHTTLPVSPVNHKPYRSNLHLETGQKYASDWKWGPRQKHRSLYLQRCIFCSAFFFPPSFNKTWLTKATASISTYIRKIKIHNEG